MPTKTKKVSKKNNTVIVNVNSHNRKKSIKTGSNSSRFQGNDHNSHVGALHVLTQSMANLLKTNVLHGQKTGEGNPPEQTPKIPHNIVAIPPTAPNASRTRRSRLLFEANEPQRPGLMENANQIPAHSPHDTLVKIPKFSDSEASLFARHVDSGSDSSVGSSKSLNHETHHQIGFPGQEAGSYMRELAQHQRMVHQRTPPNLGLNPNYTPFQHSPLSQNLPSHGAERGPARRHSGNFDNRRDLESGRMIAHLILRSGNVFEKH